MTKRPASRPSALTGRSPVRPQPDAETDVQPTPAPSTPSAPEARPEPVSEPVSKLAPKDEGKAKKVGYYMLEADLERAQRAHTTTIIHTGLRSWTAYVNEAVMAYTKQLEKEHNDSKPF